MVALFRTVFLVHLLVHCGSLTYDPEKASERCGRNIFDKDWAASFNQNSVNRVPRIVGGIKSNRGQWPWMVSLMFHQTKEEAGRLIEVNETTNGKVRVTKKQFIPESLVIQEKDGSRRFHLCGGTLIHPQWVMTAAHCFKPVEPYRELSDEPKRWSIRIGRLNLAEPESAHYEMQPERIIVHKEFKPMDIGDIALVKFPKPLAISRTINIACLPNDTIAKLSSKSNCVSIGWGHEKEGAKNISMNLRHVRLSVVTNEECNRIYHDPNSKEKDLIHDSMLCAGETKGGKDACQFDSGGPLVCEFGGQWYAMGIISFGSGCGYAGHPGIYTRVSSYLDWIANVIAKET